MERRYLTTTRNGKNIYVDPEASHAATHLADTPHLADLVTELLSGLELEDRENIYLDRDMKREVGVSDLVKTNDSDEIIYAKRPNRDIYTRFVRGRQPEPTAFVTIVLHKKASDDYELWSAWIGRAVPQFPGSEYEAPDSYSFWREHALVWGNQEVQPGTERTDWPW